jgi:hypothetical protein
MKTILTIPKISELDYPAFRVLIGDAPGNFRLPATYEGWKALMVGPRLRAPTGSEVREIPVGFAEFRDFCTRNKEVKPTIATIEKCANEIARRLFPDAEVG